MCHLCSLAADYSHACKAGLVWPHLWTEDKTISIFHSHHSNSFGCLELVRGQLSCFMDTLDTPASSILRHPCFQALEHRSTWQSCRLMEIGRGDRRIRVKLRKFNVQNCLLLHVSSVSGSGKASCVLQTVFALLRFMSLTLGSAWFSTGSILTA